ncbi:ketosteroid isomerase-like protein [Microbacterium sp. SLBN-154]|uniref:YybH family protein n=1 Tax=Microbacterium sp. SLBN-154 TaxID=2768458 RepID=UPI00114EF0CF|nr:nuclear transport factor 2 family protein [Microbacterium sp. SLBN-154]TQK17642.1 ketosteroid isomerase-like protein [Microbacterium sp. SLBN-154]
MEPDFAAGIGNHHDTAMVEAHIRAKLAGLSEAFASNDVEAYLAGFHEEATFQFHYSPRLVDGRDEYRRLWREWEQNDGFRILRSVTSDLTIRISSSVCVVVQSLDMTYAVGDRVIPSAERQTLVFAQDAGWLAIHEHNSPRPEA